MVRRRSLFRLHQALGVGSGAILLTISLTGLLLIFRSQLRPVNPKVEPVVTPLALDELVRQAEKTLPDGEKITDIHLPETPTDPYELYVDDADETLIFMDAQGQILERRKTAQGLTRILLQIHTGEILGIPGQAITMLAGMSFCMLFYTGLGMIQSRRSKKREVA